MYGRGLYDSGERAETRPGESQVDHLGRDQVGHRASHLGRAKNLLGVLIEVARRIEVFAHPQSRVSKEETDYGGHGKNATGRFPPMAANSAWLRTSSNLTTTVH